MQDKTFWENIPGVGVYDNVLCYNTFVKLFYEKITPSFDTHTELLTLLLYIQEDPHYELCTLFWQINCKVC